MKTVYLTIGPAGAGKSVWSTEKRLPVVSRDIIREDLGFVSGGQKALLGREQEDTVTKEHERRVTMLVSSGKSMILDNTNLNAKFLKLEILKFKARGYKVVGVLFKTPIEKCIQRRKGQVPEDVIRRMGERLKDIDPSWFDQVIEVTT